MNYRFQSDCQFDPATLDRLFQECFGYKTDGTFVEVGAYDGLTYSHTWGLAELGWRGVYVEPVPDLALKCIATHAGHPKITTLTCAVGRTNGVGVIFAEEGVMVGGTMNAEVCPNPTSATVQQRTLDDILAFEGIPPSFDLLTIDVDFYEVEVLAGFTAQFWTPKMVIIELHEKHDPAHQYRRLSAPAVKACEETFPPLGYQKAYADAINTIYTRS